MIHCVVSSLENIHRLALGNVRFFVFEVFQASERRIKELKVFRAPAERSNDRRVFARQVSLEKRAAVCERFAYTRRASP